MMPKAQEIGKKGRFKWCGKDIIATILKWGKRDATLKTDDGTEVTFNKRYVEVL
jgi:hypothetical protein